MASAFAARKPIPRTTARGHGTRREKEAHNCTMALHSTLTLRVPGKSIAPPKYTHRKRRDRGSNPITCPRHPAGPHLSAIGGVGQVGGCRVHAQLIRSHNSSISIGSQISPDTRCYRDEPNQARPSNPNLKQRSLLFRMVAVDAESRPRTTPTQLDDIIMPTLAGFQVQDLGFQSPPTLAQSNRGGPGAARQGKPFVVSHALDVP